VGAAPAQAQWSSPAPMCVLVEGVPETASDGVTLGPATWVSLGSPPVTAARLASPTIASGRAMQSDLGVGPLASSLPIAPSIREPITAQPADDVVPPPDGLDAETWASLRARLPADPAAALAALDRLAAEHPSVADRFALRRLEIVLERWARAPALATPPDPADCGLELALASPSSGVAARARVLQVRCLLLVDDPRGAEHLDELLRRYPELPDEVALRLELARSLERRGLLDEALSSYRELALRHPGTRHGQVAHERLATLAAQGHPFAPYSDRELVDRAVRLVRSGPPELARVEVAGLRAASLPPALAAEVALLAARLARVEGRFDEADALTEEARQLDPRLAPAPEPVARPAEEDAARALRGMGLGALVEGGATDAQRARALRRAAPVRLLEALRASARAGLEGPTTALVTEAVRRATLGPALRFEMAVLASGTASDDAVADLFARLLDDAAYGVPARFHRARSLERLGREEEARALYREVISLDRSDSGFYALWARTRLGDDASTAGAAQAPSTAASSPPGSPPSDAALAAALAALVPAHGEAYPWIARARDLLALGDRDGARQELHELYLAWLDARGRGPLRAGVEAVYRGATRPRSVVPASLRRARRELAGADLRVLADVAEAVGDVGLSIRFGGRTRASDRPRAYEALVSDAAARHALDPNLLLAVMRVESVYDPEIVSYAGAVGLLQIMPRTGRLIANRLGLTDFRTDDLLDPATNIELAAWYLASLLERFDGRLPLAIAAYNGGPHNVRRWMEEHGPRMPLDAFLERIPFDQTFRYVRRVLSHYAAYRAQQGLPLPELHTTLPPRATDGVAF
jgi:soluble lytic murein transglycosylase